MAAAEVNRSYHARLWRSQTDFANSVWPFVRGQMSHAEWLDPVNCLARLARLGTLAERAERGTCVCGEVVNELSLAPVTVSQHLETAGLVRGEVDGPRSCYCVDGTARREVADGLAAFLGPALDALDASACDGGAPMETAAVDAPAVAAPVVSRAPAASRTLDLILLAAAPERDRVDPECLRRRLQRRARRDDPPDVGLLQLG